MTEEKRPEEDKTVAPAPGSSEPTYLASSITRDVLRFYFGDAATVMPLPTDEASCEFLRGQNLVLVPLNDKDRTVRSAAAFLKASGITATISPISAEWILHTTLGKDVIGKLLQGEPLSEGAESSAPLIQDNTGCGWLRGYQRVDFPMILEDVLPAGIVGGINAEGGTGKTYLTIAMFVAVALGIPWGPFRPSRPHKVLLLLAEDPLDIVRNRIFDIAREITPESHVSLLGINFHCTSVRGLSGPLMRLEGGNAVPSAWSDWLKDTLKAHEGVELLGLDPLRKFFGLEENRNEYAHAFIGLLEEISLAFNNLTILYCHHVAKAARGAEVSQITGRGAGGFSDNCRWMAAMRALDQQTTTYLDLDGAPSSYVEFAVTKSNYAPLLPAPAYFQRGKNGVLMPMDVNGDRNRLQVEHLASLLDGQALSIREVVSQPAGKEIRASMKDRFGSSFSRDTFHGMIHRAIKAGLLAEEEHFVGVRAKLKKILVRGGGANSAQEDENAF